jgi:hypothetical protein
MSFKTNVTVPGLLISLFVACGGDDDADSDATNGTAGRAGGGEAGQPGSGGRSSSGGRGGSSDQAGQSSTDAGAPSGQAGRGDSPVTPNGVVKLRIEPGGVLLTPDIPSQKLVAIALDADGNETEVEVTWETNNDDQISVDAEGVVRREGPSASALITAKVGDVRATVFALAATPVEGAVVLSDADITAGPLAEDPGAPFIEGYRYSVELGVEPPAEGSMLLSRGDKPIAGRVVAVDGANVTLEVVPIDQVFAELVVNETLTLEDVSDDEIPAAASPLKVGPFECETDTGAVGIEFPKKTVSPTGLDTLRYDVVWQDDQKKIEVRGKPGVDFEFEPTLSAALEGGVTCKAILKEYSIPIPGPAKLFLGAAVVVGAGVRVAGKIPVAGVGVNLKGEVGADIAMGAACSEEAGCSTIQEVETSASVTPTFVAPEVSVKFEPEAQAFVYAELEGGARFSTTLRTEAIKGQAGYKLAGSFATEVTQVEDEEYASNYALSFEAEVGPGDAVDDFFGLIGFGLSFLKFEKSERLAGSPTGEADASVATFSVGDEVTFDVALEPETVNLPFVGYNIEKVRIYRRETREGGGTSLILANEQTAEPDQTRFSIPWVATVDGAIEGNFLAFVTTSLISLPLELGTVTAPTTMRTGILVDGDPFFPPMPVNDSYVFELPVGAPENPGATPLKVARVFYAYPDTDMIEVCSQQRLREGTFHISVNIAAEGELVAGTYSYADWTTGVQPGTFTTLITEHECVRSEDEPISCECNPTDIPGGYSFDSGELVLTEVEGALKGSFDVLESSWRMTAGDFTVPVCPKTFAEHTAIREGSMECRLKEE